MLDRIDVLACDYDRTLTDPDLVFEDATREALREARAAGLRVLVVSGRDADFLLRELRDDVDLVVAENGGFLVDPATGHAEPLFASWPGEALLGLGLPLECALASASCDVAHVPALEAAIARAGLEVRLELNRDRVMVLPVGVDKGTALAAALARLGVDPTRVAAAGDGENDVALFRAAAYRIAVANGVDALKAAADHVTARPGGQGVREWILRSWLPARRSSAPPPRGAPAPRG